MSTSPNSPPGPERPVVAPHSPAEATSALSRRGRAARWSLALAAGALLLLALVHGGGYVAASIAVANSGLKPLYQEAFRALWLGFSLQAAVLAGVLGLAALRPNAVSRAVAGICGLLPILNAALMLRFLGGAFTSALLVATATLVIVGMALQPSRGGAGGRS